MRNIRAGRWEEELTEVISKSSTGNFVLAGGRSLKRHQVNASVNVEPFGPPFGRYCNGSETSSANLIDWQPFAAVRIMWPSICSSLWLASFRDSCAHAESVTHGRALVGAHPQKRLLDHPRKPSLTMQKQPGKKHRTGSVSSGISRLSLSITTSYTEVPSHEAYSSL